MQSSKKRPFWRQAVTTTAVAVLALFGLLCVCYTPDTLDPAKSEVARIEIRMILNALDRFRSDCGVLPGEQEGLNALIAPGNHIGWNGPYFERLPTDPWENPYEYDLTASGQPKVSSHGPDKVLGTKDDLSGIGSPKSTAPDAPRQKARAGSESKPEPTLVDGGEFRAREMYWCSRPLLLQDWHIVLACELLGTREKLCPDFAKQEFIEGIFRIHEVILARPTEQMVFHSADALRTTGCEGLVPGDRALVFVSGYNGGYGLVPADGSNCRIGIKVPSFDAPITDAVRKWIAYQGRPAEQYGLLLDDNYAATWREYGHMGIKEALMRRTVLLEETGNKADTDRNDSGND